MIVADVTATDLAIDVMTDNVAEGTDTAMQSETAETPVAPMTTTERGSFSLVGISRYLGRVFGTSTTVLSVCLMHESFCSESVASS